MKKISLILSIIIFVSSFHNYSIYATNSFSKTLEQKLELSRGEVINGVYVTDEDFFYYMNMGYKINNSVINHKLYLEGEIRPAFAFVIPAWAIGTWVIPLVGTVVITSVSIIVNNVKQEVGSWLYNKVIEWIINKSQSEQRDFQRLSNWELKEHGYDAHKLKEEYVGKDGSKFDIYRDKNTGEIVLIDKRGVIVRTGEYIND